MWSFRASFWTSFFRTGSKVIVQRSFFKALLAIRIEYAFSVGGQADFFRLFLRRPQSFVRTFFGRRGSVRRRAGSLPSANAPRRPFRPGQGFSPARSR